MSKSFTTTPPLSLALSRHNRSLAAAFHPQNMEQTASFSCVFICVIVSVCAASAALLELSSIPSLAPLDASLQRKVKGKIFGCATGGSAASIITHLCASKVHSYKLRPTRSSGKVVGDKGATGKMWLKGLKTAQQEFYFVSKLRVDEILSGGAFPSVLRQPDGKTCLDGIYSEKSAAALQWKNLTSKRGGRLKRYSFLTLEMAKGPQADVIAYLRQYVGLVHRHAITVSHPDNDYALCGSG